MTVANSLRWLVVVCGYLWTVGFATEERFHVETWQAGSGLPGQTVNGITQTEDGYLWVATTNGLARFDGVRFKVFDGRNTPALGSGRISQVERRHGGGLWISLMEGDIVCMRDGDFSRVPECHPGGERPGAMILNEEANGRLWITARAAKLMCWDHGKRIEISEIWGTGSLQARVNPSGVPLLNGRIKGGMEIARWDGSAVQALPDAPPAGLNYHAPGRDGGLWMSDGKSVRLWKDGDWRTPPAAAGWHTRELTFGIEDRLGNHVRHIYEKLHVNSRSQAVAIYFNGK